MVSFLAYEINELKNNSKGTSVSEETEYRHRLYHNVEKGGSLSIRDTVYAYRGPGEPPSWFDEVSDPSECCRAPLRLRTN